LTMMRSLNKNLGISAEVLLKESGGSFPEGMENLEWNKFPVVEQAVWKLSRQRFFDRAKGDATMPKQTRMPSQHGVSEYWPLPVPNR